MKVTEAMQNNHRVYFILFQFEASIYHHSLQLLVFLVWFSFHLVLTTLHQPLVHWYIKQVNHSDFRFLAFTLRHFDVFDAILRERTDSQRPLTQSNNPNLYCLMPFLRGFNEFGGWDQTSQELKARNFR